jgi:hypothetical protein
MQLVDAIIEVIQADAPDKWKRYCEIAPRILGKVPAADAQRELLQGRLRHVSYDSGQRMWGNAESRESYKLEGDFLSLFVAAVRDHRYYVTGIREGKGAVEPIPTALITTETIRGLRGDRWENLGGITWHGIDVVMGAPRSPELREATDEEIHASIVEENTQRKSEGLPAWNLDTIRKPVQDRLRNQGLYASFPRIQGLYRDKRYAGLRALPGPRRKKDGPS